MWNEKWFLLDTIEIELPLFEQEESIIDWMTWSSCGKYSTALIAGIIFPEKELKTLFLSLFNLVLKIWTCSTDENSMILKSSFKQIVIDKLSG